MSCCSEFQLRHAKLHITCLDDFTHSKVFNVRPVYLAIYRTIVAMNCIMVTILSAIVWGKLNWPVYLTNVNYMFTTFYFTISSVSSIYGCKLSCQKRKVDKDCVVKVDIENGRVRSVKLTSEMYAEPSTSFSDSQEVPDLSTTAKTRYYLCKIQLLSFLISINLNVLVVLGYWLMLGGYKITMAQGLPLYLNMEAHALGLVYITVEFLLNRVRIHLFQGFYVMLVGLFYSIFVVIVWKISGFAPYKVLDFGENPSFASINVLIAIFVVLPLLHSIWFGFNFAIYKFLDKRAAVNNNNYCQKKEGSQGPSTEC